ncbi:permease-like cell division protein FtsX [Endozoicomonas sp. GU-1]|uniref:permease-like cell division protein FtsX n=1 Tax=Endozoicomonas sp. GU-1 TaxID=3009078 RepID=UPI0022B38C4C|nr:permease-like cell division protein FtsX [Endozoicomonas sp. GU-1]WBA82577.1 permease-like cell division protein FtsX [Endozoicomonas sp. GU-1]WBA85506.1 permease-like cell division protein FtsX [Endozoicomonas sp. GU-1]
MSLFSKNNRRQQNGRRHTVDEQAGMGKTAGKSAGSFVPKEANKDAHKRGANRQTVATLTLHSFLSLHRQVGRDALTRLLNNPVASLLNSLLIAVAFSLPVLLFVLVSNVQVLGAAWDGQPKISIYLNHGVSQKIIDQRIADYRQDPLIKEVVYLSPEQGVNDFQQKAGLQDVISQLGFNPLPGVIELLPAIEASFEQLDDAVVHYQQMEGVDQVRLDRQWVQRLQAILTMLERFAIMLGGILGLTVVLVISNTVRLSIESRRDEIKIISMVGGTRGFIAMPFIYMGIWYGVIGAILAQVIVFSLLAVLSHEMMNIAGLYNSEMVLSGPGFGVLGVLLLAGIAFGVLGAISSCYRHFQALVPD